MRKPVAMPMFGTTDAVTFMGVAAAAPGDNWDADIAIFGAPCATPYPAAIEYTLANLDAPRAIREGIRMWSPAIDRFDWDLGDLPFAGHQSRVVDLGDLATRPESAADNRALIGATTAMIVAKGAVPFVIGGDDSVPVPVIEALAPRGKVHILQIDAHIDWRDTVDGERLGLSSVMRRASELPFVGGIVQVGTRGLSSAAHEEIATARAWGAEIFTAQHVFDHGVAEIIERIPAGAQVHINFDLDGLDPSIMPAVFVPAPGGLLYWHAAKLLLGVAARANICSLAMVEFAPGRDKDGTAALTAGRLFSLAMGAILKQQER